MDEANAIATRSFPKLSVVRKLEHPEVWKLTRIEGDAGYQDTEKGDATERSAVSELNKMAMRPPFCFVYKASRHFRL